MGVMGTPLRSITAFCGAAAVGGEYLELAARFGASLAERGHTLVYGGASVGLMGAMADAALAGGGSVIGVIPDALVQKEIAHDGLTELIVVDSMHARKAKMVELGDAFVTLPGGFGTLDELFEIVTFAQLGMHDKPIGILDAQDYYQHLLAFVARAVRDGFVKPEHGQALRTHTDPDLLLDALADADAAFEPALAHESVTSLSSPHAAGHEGQARRQPAVHHQALPVHVAGSIGKQKRRQLGNLGRDARATQGVELADLVLLVLRAGQLEQGARHFGFHQARANGVHANPAARELGCAGAHQIEDRCLAGAVGCRAGSRA